MKIIASLISRAIRSEDPTVLAGIKSEVHALTSKFPIYSA
jgi:glycine hydroxymethyltransferase